MRFKIISGPAMGFPIGKGESFHERLASGMNQEYRKGWRFVAMIGTEMMAFERCRPKRRRARREKQALK